MSRESLVAALEEAGVPSEAADRERIRVFFEARGEILVPEVRDRMTRAIIATDADLLLPILLRHASPEAKAAALRGLLGERLVRMKGEELLRADAAFARLAASWKAKVFNAVTHNTLRARFVEILAPEAR